MRAEPTEGPQTGEQDASLWREIELNVKRLRKKSVSAEQYAEIAGRLEECLSLATKKLHEGLSELQEVAFRELCPVSEASRDSAPRGARPEEPEG